MKRIIVFVAGRTCSGKSTLIEQISKHLPSMGGYKVHIVPEYTTRPLRENEVGKLPSEIGIASITEEELDQYRTDGKVIIENAYTVANGEVWKYAILDNDMLFPTNVDESEYKGIISVVPTSIYSATEGMEWVRNHNLDILPTKEMLRGYTNTDYEGTYNACICYVYADDLIVVRRSINRDLTTKDPCASIKETFRRFDASLDPNYRVNNYVSENIDARILHIISLIKTATGPEFKELRENAPITFREMMRNYRREIERCLGTQQYFILENNDCTPEELCSEFEKELSESIEK